jgi:hypothetical protein
MRSRRPSRAAVLIGLIVLASIAGFAALVLYDRSQQAPAGVQTFDESKGVNNHTQGTVKYDHDPPAGGQHNPVWQNQGFYDKPVRNENAVHTLEHGGVWITYRPDLPQDQKDRIRDVVQGQDCMLASPYPDLPENTPVVASAWGVQMKFESADNSDLDKFVNYYRKGPQTPEPNASCTGGTSDTVSS